MGERGKSPAHSRQPLKRPFLVAAILCATYAGLAGYSFRGREAEEKGTEASRGEKDDPGVPCAHVLPVFLGWGWFGPAGGVPCLVLSTAMLIASGEAPWIAALAAPAMAAYLLRRRQRLLRHRLRQELDSAFEKQNALAGEKELGEAKVEGVRRTMERFGPLQKVAEKLLATISAEECARILVSESLRVIDHADAALIYLVDEASGNLMIGDHAPANVRVESIAGDEADREVFLRARPKLVERVAESGYQPKTKARAVESFVAVPIVVRERVGDVVRSKVAGVLRLDAAEPGAFGRDELEILGYVADLGAQAFTVARLHERTQKLAMRDTTTGLYVISFFKERMNEELARSRRTGRQTSLLMLDIDHFKRFNDRWGHPAGDDVLKGIADVLANFARTGDMPCRYGGEELALLLHEPKGKAAEVARMVRERVMHLRFGEEGAAVTVSIGVASFPKDGDDVDSFIDAADKALYSAKRQGRNRVCIA